MSQKLIWLFAFVAAVASVSDSVAQSVSPAEKPVPATQADPARETAADRLIAVQHPETMLATMGNEIANQMPKGQAERFLASINDPSKVDRIKARIRSLMIKYFTTDELNVMAEFYAKSAAQDAMRKMDRYMGEYVPFIQSEVQRLADDSMKK